MPATAAKVVVAGVGVVGAVIVVMGWLVEGKVFLQTRAATTKRTVAKSVPANHACTRRVFWLSGEVGPSSSLWTGLEPAPVAVGPCPLPCFEPEGNDDKRMLLVVSVRVCVCVYAQFGGGV